MKLLILALFLVCLLLYTWFVEPRLLSIKEELVELERKKVTRPIRFLFLSDLHCGRYNSNRLLLDKIEQLRRYHEQKPFQAILLGGDFLDRETIYLSDLLKAVKALKRFQVPILAVLGNHDLYAYKGKPEPLLTALGEAGVVVLGNQSRELTLEGEPVRISGLPELEASPLYYARSRSHLVRMPSRATYRKWAEQLDWYRKLANPVDHLHILLSHNPDGAYLPGEPRPDVILSGHTHGGQVWPNLLLGSFWRSSLFMPPGSFAVWSGRTLVNGSVLLVSRGLGGARFPIRLFRPAQALVVTVQGK